ncbi:MAG: DEAD/DEAH box helicase [Chloroflexota bacterium]|nr:DEAD/DEAH box helicase [Chloroflexota bacterium]
MEETTFGDFRLGNASLQVLAGMGITSPTPIQAEVLPFMLDGRDVIGQARTGSGKTLAFALPLIEVVDPRLKAVQALVLTPTRELAVQVAQVVEELGARRGIKTLMISGGRSFGPQRDELRRGVHVVVGTPGRVLDLLNQGALWLDRVRFLVLDEADEMLDRGFAPDVERIIARTTPDRQTALFSATVPAWVKQTATKHLNEPVTVTITPEPGEVAQIEHTAFDIGSADKMQILEELLNERGDGSIIVFGRTKHGVNKLARRLQASGFPVAALQGNLSQNARDRVMEDFRNGQVPILIATNVAARGLDVSHVEQVINVELPESPELLTHRIGRTGRMGRQGQAITLLGPEDLVKWRRLERGFTRPVVRAPWRGAHAAVNETSAEHAAAAPAAARPANGRSTPSRSPRAHAPARPAGSRAGQEATASLGIRPAQSSAPRAPRRDGPAASRASIPAQSESSADLDGRELQRRYGRDPRRPAWADGTREDGLVIAAEPTTEQSRSSAPGRQRRTFESDCAGCGQIAQTNFRPDPARPVYCDSCYRAQKERRRAETETAVTAS